MNWTYRRPFRQQVNGVHRPARSNKLIYFRQGKDKEKLFEQPIDAIRLQLADSSYVNRKIEFSFLRLSMSLLR